jgi:hypothetical protein
MNDHGDLDPYDPNTYLDAAMAQLDDLCRRSVDAPDGAAMVTWVELAAVRYAIGEGQSAIDFLGRNR